MIGKRLQELRKNLKMTQEELSEKLAISRSSLSLYEIDKREPDGATLIKIADYFDISLDNLFDRVKTNQDITPPLPHPFLTSSEEKLLELFRQLTTETYQEKALVKFEGYIDCLMELDSDSLSMGKSAQSTPSKKNVG
ncbi:MAG: helix-turn-helix domain-containing protein [Firmicutes bacterium]|nr:helix-turn-helix domain-containing protein [Bacillota bacterium]